MKSDYSGIFTCGLITFLILFTLMAIESDHLPSKILEVLTIGLSGMGLAVLFLCKGESKDSLETTTQDSQIINNNNNHPFDVTTRENCCRNHSTT
uniref:Uncharacterized protein n=1 Tax=Lepeophtheirus salmonis TaxID=72036 RepID=A0A0K2U943_LEPSM